MKKYLLLAAISLLATKTIAQQNEPETLFGSKINLSQIGFMVDPGFQFTKVAGVNTSFYQIRAGVVFNDKFTIGGFYGESPTEIRPASFASGLPATANVNLSMGGGFIEYTPWSGKVVHLTFPVAIGALNMEGDDYGYGNQDGESNKLFIEPAAHLEVNLHKYVRFHAGVGYRVMGDSGSSRGIIPEAENAVSVQAGLKIGMFQIKK